MKKMGSNEVKNWLLEMFKTIAISVILVFLITTFIFKPVRVDGSSMYPTLQDGSVALAGVITLNNGISRFDVVTIYLDFKDEYLVKRVVGLPNEEIAFKNNILYVNGEEIAEDFLNSKFDSNFSTYTEDFSVKLGENEYFCLGDNRLNSLDSRKYGPFSLNQIKSEGLFILLPFNRIGVVK